MAEENTGWLHPDNEKEAEIRYLAENTDLSPNQAKELVEKHGVDREKLLELARQMKAEG